MNDFSDANTNSYFSRKRNIKNKKRVSSQSNSYTGDYNYILISKKTVGQAPYGIEGLLVTGCLYSFLP